MEMELKLLADPEAKPLVEQHPALSGLVPILQTTTSTYYDTADLAIYRLGAILRVREAGGGFVQTVKLDRPEDRLGSRGEWEWPVESAAPNLGKLDELPEAAAAIRDAARDIAPMFKTVVARKTWLVRCEDGTLIEAVYDEGVIEAGGRRVALSEVELELKHGSPAEVFRLAIDLAKRAGLRFGGQSKSARGFGLLSHDLPDRPDRPGVALPAFDASVDIGVLVPRLIDSALRDLVAELAGASAGDVEAVHRMRAAIRKLRSILVLFRPYLRREATRLFDASLRQFAGTLGRARDWDVFLTETLPHAEAEDLGTEAEVLRGRAERERVSAYAAVAEAIRSAAVTSLILKLGAWTQDAGWLRKLEPDAPCAPLVPALLGELDRKARKRVKHLDTDDVEDLHDLRKALKKLRYGIDYMATLFEPDAVRRYNRAIKDVLWLLGEINDRAVTAHCLDVIAEAAAPPVAGAAAALSRLSERQRDKATVRLSKTLKAFREQTPFWF